MSNFRSRMILTLLGVIFINFAVVFVAFNVLIRQYIYSQAKNEINRSVNFVTSRIAAVGPPENIISFQGVSFSIGGPITNKENDGTLSISLVDRIAEGYPIVTTDTLPVTESIMSTQAILLSEDNKVDPSTVMKSTLHGTEIQNLYHYYKDNEEKFQDDNAVEVSVNSNNYLMTLAKRTASSGAPMLLYTNITPINNFADQINIALLCILLISGAMVAIVGIRMTKGFNKSVLSLCARADQIGRGDFKQRHMKLKYKEFNQISGSMEKMSEMLESYEQQQKIFFQNASHELRTPLMSIQGYAEGIREGVFDDSVQAAEVIVDESAKMSLIVHELLYASRMDSGLHKLEIEEIDFDSFIRECVDRVSLIATKAEKTIDYKSDNESINIYGDREQLSRCVINILSNGIRHCDEGVKISYEKLRGKIKIIIEDDGDGIKIDDLPNIFQRFYKGESGNYGLGLSIARDIIKGHDGTISAYNLEKGACFSIELPLCNKLH